jgi:hypothetical protein
MCRNSNAGRRHNGVVKMAFGENIKWRLEFCERLLQCDRNHYAFPSDIGGM